MQNVKTLRFTVLVGTVFSMAFLLPCETKAQAPVISSQPASQTNIVGAPVAFSVSATGTLPLSYQWLKNGVPLVSATNYSLVFSHVRMSDTAQYSVVASNSLGMAVSSNAQLTVNLPQAGDVDWSFTTPVMDGPISTMALQPDGRVLIGGPFTTVGGRNRSGVARLNGDGSLDRSFLEGRSGVDFQGDPRAVSAIAVQSDGKVLIGGAFDLVNGVIRNNLARLNPNGSLDQDFLSDTNVGGADGFVTALVLTTDQMIWIGGAFIYVNGDYAPGVTRLGSNGNLDPPPFTSYIGSQYIYTLKPLEDESIIIGGDLLWWLGYTTTPVGILKVNADGSLDTAFIQTPDDVYSIQVQADGKVLMGGNFNNLNSEPRNGIARLNVDGTLDVHFLDGLAGVEGGVKSLALQPDGRIVIGGEFTTVNGVAENYVARLNSDGNLDTSFLNGLPGIAPDFSGWAVDTVQMQADGYVLVGGSFTNVNGISLTNVARLYGTAATPPVITSVSQPGTNSVGGAVTLSVSAWGTGPLSFQWQKSGTNLMNGGRISGATNSSLTITNLQLTDTGDYSAVVSSDFGIAVSSNATLVVVFTQYTPAHPVVYNQPPMNGQLLVIYTNFVVTVTGGGTTFATNQYYPTLPVTGTDTGTLTVNIGPNSPTGSGWRFLGETIWRLSGSTVSNLLPDTYFVEFAPVSGWSPPASMAAQVFGGQDSLITANYLLAQSPPGSMLLPVPVPTNKINDLFDYSFGFNGQLMTDVGYGSGVAVQPNVVLTAAHLVFNDYTLSYASQAYWYFQREAGVFEPEPMPARGWYVLSGYASQRTNDLLSGLSPNQSSPQSRNFDVAALYFTSPVAGGGYAGYLPSDTVPNPWLTGNSLKMLVGYPVDGSQFGNAIVPGQMYQVGPQTNGFMLDTNAVNNQQVYTASWFLSYPGNSGGAMFVQFNGYYYPAAVYLGTLYSGNLPYASLVRGIDSSVVNLITNAATLGDAGTNNTGGGVITLIAGQASASNPAYVQVNLGPADAVSAGAGWRLQGDASYGTAANYTRAVTSGNAVIVFKPISGWNLPTNQSVSLTAGQLTRITASYSLAFLTDLAAGISGPATVAAANDFTYTLLITNLGSSAASSVTVTDSLPAGVVFVSASGGGTNKAGTVTWPALATLPNGGRTNYSLTVTAPEMGWLTNTLSVGSATADTNAANNTAKLVTQVIVTPPVLVANVANGIGISGTPGTRYRMEFRNSLSVGQWLPLQTNTIGASINYVLPWPPTNGSAGFYRAVWLP